MVIEAGVAGAAAIRFLPVAGDRNQAEVVLGTGLFRLAMSAGSIKVRRRPA
jgi:hypothetical protein